MHHDPDPAPLPNHESGLRQADKQGREAAAQSFADAVQIMARLRSPDGCPWDREQDFDSIRRYTLEETYEVLDAIERRDWTNLREELGDLLLQVLFYSQMASERDPAPFTITDVLDELNRKLIRRHPHVFGAEASRAAGNQTAVDPAVNGSSDRVLANWEAIKQAEKPPTSDASLLHSVVRGQPALSEAAQLGSKAAKVHFDWPQWTQLLDKLREETAELLAETDQPADAPARHSRIEAELGDMLFTTAQLARHLGVDAEMALRGSNLRFRSRFARMETITAHPLATLSTDALEQLWQQAKRELALQESQEPQTREPQSQEPQA